MKTYLIFLSLFLWGSVLLYSQESDTFKAWINIDRKNNLLTIKAFCYNNTLYAKNVHYKLDAQKTGKAGHSHTSQSGAATIKGQSKKCLSKASMNISAKDHYKILLVLYKDGKLAAKDSINYP